ncbi:MAG: diaminopimelate epimerase [Pseudomonadota bacterium]|nr:diaminopimelate epimerase [Pseudomonadota bacterium]
MKLAFTKMHGAGNDFVVIDGVTQVVNLSTAQLRRLADRHRGIGCDQILMVTPPDNPDADFRCHIFNADGSRAGQCGNGARCIGRFLKEKRLTRKRDILMLTDDNSLSLSLTEDGRVFAGLGAPRFAPQEVPFQADEIQDQYTLDVQGQSLSIGALSMGNPHAILIVDDCDAAPVSTLGPLLEAHVRFPERVNVGFLQIQSRGEVKLRVFERGVGETDACGSGACAAAVHGIKLGLLDEKVTVNLPGGKLSVSWQSGDDRVWLGGPTATVFHGTVTLKG